MRPPDRRLWFGMLAGAGLIVLFLLGALVGEAHRGAEQSVVARPGDPSDSVRAVAGSGANVVPDAAEAWLEPLHDDATQTP